MKEFLILKKVSASAVKSVDCAVKLLFNENTVTVSGEIYNGASFSSNYKVCLTNGIDSILLSKDTVRFEKTLTKEFISGGYIVVFDGEDNAILYGAYKTVNYSLQDAIDLINSKREIYNDDEIATVNYYEGEIYETERVYNQPDCGDCENKETAPKKEECDGALLYENFAKPSKSHNFYEEVEQKLDQIISSHKKDDELCKLIPNGEFCLIEYDSDRFYSVGRVFENGEIKFICYAVKGNLSQKNKQLEKYCRFIPLSPFCQDSGYFVIFQDAQTGSIIEN